MLRLFEDNTRGLGSIPRGTALNKFDNSANGGAPRQHAGRCTHSGYSMARTASLAVLAVALSGCGMSSLTSGLGGGMFGGSSQQTASDTVNADQLLTAAKAGDTSTTGSTAVGEIAHGCPRMVVPTRDNNITFYEPGRAGDGLAIMHRGEITKTARECQIEPGRVTVRYGFSGRVLLGPRGKPGNVILPVNVAVTDAKRAKIAGDAMKVEVDVGSDKPIGYFSAVRTVTFDIPEGSRPGEFEVQVGFDNQAAGAG